MSCHLTLWEGIYSDKKGKHIMSCRLTLLQGIYLDNNGNGIMSYHLTLLEEIYSGKKGKHIKSCRLRLLEGIYSDKKENTIHHVLGNLLGQERKRHYFMSSKTLGGNLLGQERKTHYVMSSNTLGRNVVRQERKVVLFVREIIWLSSLVPDTDKYLGLANCYTPKIWPWPQSKVKANKQWTANTTDRHYKVHYFPATGR